MTSESQPVIAPEYEAEVAAWRREHEEGLVREDGWLSQTALHWLTDGALELDVGTFVPNPEGVRFLAAPGIDARVDGAPATDRVLRDDRAGAADVVRVGGRRYQLVARGDDLAIRVRDREAPARVRFRGLSWYPVRAAWRVVGRLEADADAGEVHMVFTEGQEEPATCPGAVVFEVDGVEHRLRPYARPSGELLFVFRDRTNADTTYALCRYFYAPAPDAEGKVVLDFNRAAAPVCAFVPFVTCVLPPPENRLALRVEAGELRYDPDPDPDSDSPAHAGT